MKYNNICIKRETLRIVFTVLVVGLLFSLSLSSVLALDVPKLPHAFYGSLIIDGSPAPAGVKVEVKGTGIATGTDSNPIYTSETGKYGDPGPYGIKLLAQGGADIEDGTELTFFVDDVDTGQTFLFQSGEITELDLIVTSTPPPAAMNSLEVSSTGGGCVDIPGEAGPYYYPPGFDAPLLAVPDECFSFVEWTGDVGTVDNVTAADTFITMSGNYTIMAVFAPAGIEIPFNKGWNTFSTPVILHDCMDTWNEFIAINGIGVSMVYRYDSATEYWVEPAGVDEIICGYGYYVHVNEQALAHAYPDTGAAPFPIALARGVHLIGTPQLLLEEVDVATALASIYEATNEYSGYVLVVSPYINSPNDWEYIRDGDDPPVIPTGRALWVVIENDSSYE